MAFPRLDGWKNLFTLAGSNRDRTTQGSFYSGPQISMAELDGLYSAGGLARRIIDLPAQDMTREWLTINDERGEELNRHMSLFDVRPQVTRGLAMGRLFGGALGVVIMDDGRELSEPLNERGIKSIDGIRIYDRYQITWTHNELYNRPEDRRYGMPEVYIVTPYSGGSFRVHESRVVRFPGLSVSERQRVANDGWDFSHLEPVYQALMDHDGAHRSSASIIGDFVQTVMSVKGLTDMLAAGNEDQVKKRLDILDMSRSVLNTLLMDADGEQFSKQSSSVAGLSDLLAQFRIQISAITGIPMTKLFGMSAPGMNSTGESDIRNYYDEVSTQQEYVLRPIVERLAYLAMLDKSGPYSGRPPADWGIEFNPLWQMSDKEAAEVRRLTAEADAIYIDRGVFNGMEIADARTGPEPWKNSVEVETMTRGLTRGV